MQARTNRTFGIKRNRAIGSMTRKILLAVLILLGVVLVMAPNLIAELPDRDAGVFLYVGSRILDGEIPYRDIWDHKGPLIYYINAIGIALTPGSERGVWALEVITLSLSGFGLYRLLRKGFGPLPAVLAVGLFYAGLGYVLYPGNYTEEFSLPLQIGALLLFDRTEAAGGRPWRWAAIGLTGAATVLLRPNNAGIHLAIFIYVILESLSRGGFRRGLANSAYLGVGVLLLLIPVLAYFGWQRALPELFDSVIRFNSAYVEATVKARIDSILEGFRLLAPTGLPVFTLAVWTMACLRLVVPGSRSQEPRLVRLAVIGFPIELLMVGISGRSLNHYFIAWLPISAVLAARFFQHLMGPSDESELRLGAAISPRVGWAVGLALVILILPLRRLLPPFLTFLDNGSRDAFERAADLTQYDEEYLLMWGAESTFNFLSDKPAPTRYVYQYPLYTCGYVSPGMVEEFREDIASRHPLIVDSSSSNPAVPPIDAEARSVWSEPSDNCGLTASMRTLLTFIGDHYELAGRMFYTGWPIYRVQN